jgi:hypothetical protein
MAGRVGDLDPLAVEPPGRGEQAARVDHVPGTALVDPDLAVGEARRQRSRRTGMVEMDVRQRDDPRRMRFEHGQQLFQTGRGARVHDDVADPPGAHDVRVAEVQEVDQLRRVAVQGAHAGPLLRRARRRSAGRP